MTPRRHDGALPGPRSGILWGVYPPTRTFQPRRRKLSATRQRVLDEHGPEWVLDVHGVPLDLSRPTVLEIGIGRGEALLVMATAEPDIDVIGVDVHTPGIAAVIAGGLATGLTNVRLVHGDVLEFVDRLAPAALAGIRMFFPDPWPKSSKQHKRIVVPANVDRLVALLAPGGYLHLATDIADYAEQMERVCAAHPELTGGPIPRPTWRPETRYERKGLDAGRTVTDLWYLRAPPCP